MATYSGSFVVFFFNDTATTEIYTLSLHDALPISPRFTVGKRCPPLGHDNAGDAVQTVPIRAGNEEILLLKKRLSGEDRKSTRLNSSHANISYAVFCLKKKKTSSYTPRCYAPHVSI